MRSRLVNHRPKRMDDLFRDVFPPILTLADDPLDDAVMRLLGQDVDVDTTAR